jgi:hypothetical protein
VPELLIGSVVTLFLVAMAIRCFTTVSANLRGGSRHMQMIDRAREVQQTLARIVERGRAVGVQTDRLQIVMPDLTLAEVRYIDGDSDPATLEDNILEYDPNIDIAGGGITLCEMLSPVAGEAMFQIVPTSPRTAMMTFHVGDRPPAGGGNLLLGGGYHGVEVRAAATPRNGKGFIQ